MRIASGRLVVAAAAAVIAVALVSCTAPAERTAPPSSPPGTPTPTASATPTPSPSPTPVAPPAVMVPTGVVETMAQGLQAPWSILRLPDGGTLVSERDTARIVEVTADGSLRVAGTVPDVVTGAEGGLLGLAHLAGEGGTPGYVYAYFTATSENRIVRMPLSGAPGSLAVGAPETVLGGIPRGAANHQGGRIAFGPDGFLYATVGDGGLRDPAQDPSSLAGKILRMTPEGQPAPGNPFGSLVYSIGHRNPQGLAWDATGAMWAAEFGQNTWDELNRITPGANYGWPVVEGQGGVAGYVDPVLQWPTSEASPSGLAVVGDTLFLAALRGERLLAAAPASTGVAPPTAWFVDELGRLRDVAPGPDGELWVLTNNTDGRGSPSEGDDRLLRVRLAPAG
ncbi:PQQ-dependent sugar dehydrogenase [Agromyces allii]|uniref:PQQ-dependent sugar dehydrogenase n=1 Tax=Agromyces allii TaxID=393607 RepID=A0ABN2Q2L0_9MICO|nr:PQQ-dependent sugar dehydrogenase [Agromyces allii]